ncbi:MAG TPA: GTPase [Candidatus Nanoarchaeia archaeon]|nr:GTPase [Candidatus Nanoarchaeia archaeon]
MGAAGRDYHNFLVYFKDNPFYQVAGFTVNQIPGLEHRAFPQQLAGSLYHADIPVFPESRLAELIKELKIDEVYLSYSDLSFQQVMEKGSLVLAAGAKFCMLGTETMINTSVPVVAVTAVRTGCGKSQTARRVAYILKDLGYKVVAIRHPMPYGNLLKEEVQRFADDADLKKAQVTFEEREEYEPWVRLSIPVYAGVDYRKILSVAEKEADVIIWDGGNNDFSFLKPDLHIVVTDPLRPDHERTYYPGLVNVMTADVVVINKVDSVPRKAVAHVMKNIRHFNKHAEIITAASPVTLLNPSLIAGKKALVVEDGPTLTHGGLSHGAGTVAAIRYKAQIIDARLFAKGSLVDVYKQYSHLGKELPAMGYGKQQVKDLQDTLNAAKCDVIIDGSPMNLQKVVKCNKPIVRVNYELQETSRLTLKKVLSKHFKGE